MATCYDWLSANGITGWLPERPMIAVDPIGCTLTVDVLSDAPADPSRPGRLPHVRQVTVALLAPLTPRVRDCLVRNGAVLLESA